MAAVVEPPATRRLREFYKLGQRLLKESQRRNQSRAPAVKNYWGVNEELQEKHGLSLNDIACARRFAERYSEDDLNELCRLGQTRGKPRKKPRDKPLPKPLTKSHVFMLVTIDDAKARTKWAKRAAQGGWSVLRLRFEIAAATSKQSSEGKGSMPDVGGPVHALFHTRRLAVKWINWQERLRQETRATGDPRLQRLLARRKLAALLKKVTDQMTPLLVEVERLIAEGPRGD